MEITHFNPAELQMYDRGYTDGKLPHVEGHKKACDFDAACIDKYLRLAYLLGFLKAQEA